MCPFLCNESVLHLINRLSYLKILSWTCEGSRSYLGERILDTHSGAITLGITNFLKITLDAQFLRSDWQGYVYIHKEVKVPHRVFYYQNWQNCLILKKYTIKLQSDILTLSHVSVA